MIQSLPKRDQQQVRRQAWTAIAARILLSVILAVVSIARVDSADATPNSGAQVDTSDTGMVVSDSAVASRIGRDLLQRGGTAVDAAVATAFALAVSWPDAGNIGGGGFMIIRPANGKDPVCIDYRETAPQAMTATSYTKHDTTYSQKAVGVPGTVRGLAEAHARYGKLPWQEVVMPAAKLAADGVPVTAPLADSLNGILARDEVKNNAKYAELRRVYGKGTGQPWREGDRLVLPDLARTLTEIARQGADAFYTGRIAQLIVAEMQRGDGLISLDDLSRYQAKVRPAMQGSYNGFTIIGAPPPSSGGTCMIEALNILENFDLASRDRFDPQNIHLIAEACRRAFADRARYLGDPDFTEIPTHLVSKDYAKELAQSIDRDAATPSDQIAPEIKLADESPDTTHFSVIDARGMAVSNTYTLEASWGSRIVVAGAGFVLNNEMGDFNWFPGVTNREGRIGTPANTIAPGKRMLSSQSPTIVERDGRVVLVTGSPGGRTIINTVLCIVLNVTEFAMSAVDAVDAPRMHHQWFPDQIELERIEQPPHAAAVAALSNMGHHVVGRSKQGSAHSIAIEPDSGRLIGIADYRRDGRPAPLGWGTLAIWDFADLQGTQLNATSRLGKPDIQWSGAIANSTTDGRDHFRIQRRGRSRPASAYVDLSAVNMRFATVAVEVKIDAAHLLGKNRNEQLRIDFADGRSDSQVTARMLLGRSGSDQIILRGEAPGGTSVAPVIISQTGELTRPIVLRLSFETIGRRYAIAYRDASSPEFKQIGSGSVAKRRQVNFLRLSTLNDFAANGEYVNIDRIDLRTEVEPGFPKRN